MRHFILHRFRFSPCFRWLRCSRRTIRRPIPAVRRPASSKTDNASSRTDAILGETMWIPVCYDVQLPGPPAHACDHRGAGRPPHNHERVPTVATRARPVRPSVVQRDDSELRHLRLRLRDHGRAVQGRQRTARAPSALHQDLGNTIDVRTNAIDVMKSDGVTISDNRLMYASERGRGVVLELRQRRQHGPPGTRFSTRTEPPPAMCARCPGGRSSRSPQSWTTRSTPCRETCT